MYGMNITHMVIKMNYGQALGRSTEDLADFAETTKVPFNDVLFVEGWRHISTLDDSAVDGRHAT